jgi:hypothetical protein
MGVIVKRLHKEFACPVDNALQQMLTTGLLPKRMEKGKGNSHSQIGQKPNSVRYKDTDTSLLSIPGKCLEKLVIERLNYFFESTGQIPPQQYGFTAGRSTADDIKTVLDFVRHSRKLDKSAASWQAPLTTPGTLEYSTVSGN